MKKFAYSIFLILLLSCSDDGDVFGGGLEPGPSSERLSKMVKGSRNPDYGYWEYLPVGYGNGKKWPLMLFFHGLGENGDGSAEALEKLLRNGPPNKINNDLWPIDGSSVGDEFVVLSVQTQQGCPKADDINSFMRWAAQEYEVDVRRIYLTGLSCGAIGTWSYISKYLKDHLIAAAVPIAGNGTYAWNNHKCDLGALPIWAFHGDNDNTVNVSGTNTPLDGLENCSNPSPLDARKTIYPGVGHNSWSRTYDLSAGHDIYAWMLSHVNKNASLE